MQTVQSNTPNIDKLKMLITKRAGYSKEVKARVLKQFDGLTTDISDENYWIASGNINDCLESNKKFLADVKSLKKFVVKLERHSYAPELNTLHLKDGQEIKTPRCQDIETAIVYAVRNKLIK